MEKGQTRNNEKGKLLLFKLRQTWSQNNYATKFAYVQSTEGNLGSPRLSANFIIFADSSGYKANLNFNAAAQGTQARGYAEL